MDDGFCAQEFVVEVRTLRCNFKRWARENSRAQGCTSSFEKHPYPPKNGGLPRSAVARPAQQAYTIGVPPDLSYFLAPTSNTKRSRLQASQRTVQLGGKNRGRCGWQLQQSVYKRRDGARGPTLPRKQHAYIYRAALAHVCIAQRRARTLSPRSLPAAGAPHALTQPAHPVGRPRPCFFLLRSASCLSGSNS